MSVRMASGLKKKPGKKQEGSLPITFSMTSTYIYDPLFEIYTLVWVSLSESHNSRYRLYLTLSSGSERRSDGDVPLHSYGHDPCWDQQSVGGTDEEQYSTHTTF